MDVFELRKKVVEDYARYVRSFVSIRDKRIAKRVADELDGGYLWPEPLLQLNPAFEPGEAMRDLVAADTLHPECLKIFANKDESGRIGSSIRLHQHQVAGLRAAREGDSSIRHRPILASRTHSGKRKIDHVTH